MIKSIALTNFQSHEDTTLALAPGVNAIVGPSDSGKTAIIRAINWVINNRPGGEGFRSRWGGDTEVNITVDETMVSRIRGKENLYVLAHHGAVDHTGFKAFGQGIPPEVTNALHMSPVNLQTQMDPPFMLSNSPGEVARYLNRVADLEVIDSSLASIASTLRAESLEITTVEGQIGMQEESLAAYAWLPEAEGRAEVLRGLESGLKDKQAKKAELAALIPEATDANAKMKRADKFLNAFEQTFKHLDATREMVYENAADEARLKALIADIRKTKGILSEAEHVAQFEENVLNLDTRNTVNQERAAKANAFDALIEQADKAQDAFEDIETELATAQREFKKLMPKTCPLCGAGAPA